MLFGRRMTPIIRASVINMKNINEMSMQHMHNQQTKDSQIFICLTMFNFTTVY